ncbi:hypothetical protein [Streptomyces sp. NPDC001127]|uniref:hypothetical protein n=1 Tax=Streptomyces sp. NPDC001127 TaxID=3154377 RepID=UPI003326D9B6
MSVVLPNEFSCIARTAVFDESEPVDFRHLAQPGVPAGLVEQLQVKRFLVTTSRVHSTVSKHHAIDFVETLIKIPVVLYGRWYLYPVVTFVDNEYSLIRGYLLGFNKVFAAKSQGCHPLTLVQPGLDVDFRADKECGSTVPELPTEQNYGLLLWTDYSIGEGVRSRGFANPIIHTYVRDSVVSLKIARENQIVAGRKLVAQQLYEIRDRFVIPGTVPVSIPN